MEKLTFTPEPITRENFAPYGDIISLKPHTELSAVSSIKDDANTAVKVITANKYCPNTPVPFFECHPLSTQTFIPVNGGQFFVLVAYPTVGDTFDFSTAKCFITDGTQGIQYKENVWHAPFSCLESDKNFVILDRNPNVGDSDTINIRFAKSEKDIFISL